MRQQIAQSLGNRTILIPEKGKEALEKAIQQVSSLITVHSPIGVGNEDLPKVKADAVFLKFIYDFLFVYNSNYGYIHHGLGVTGQ